MQKAHPASAGLTLIELVVVVGIAGILSLWGVPLALQAVRSFMFLPKSQLANQVALEALHAVIEGSHSSLTGQAIGGLRYASRQTDFQGPAIWLAEGNRIGYLARDNRGSAQRIVLRLDGDLIKRSISSGNACPPQVASEEVIPYHAANSVRLTAPANGMLRYYTQAGREIGPPGCLSFSALDSELDSQDMAMAAPLTIRRVDVAFVAQTGGGSFEQGDARVSVASSVAIRFP